MMATAPLADWRQLVRPTRGQPVYNPNKETIVRSCNGNPYRFPPGISELYAQYKGDTIDGLMNLFFGDSQHAAQAGCRPLFSDDLTDPRNVAVMKEADEFAEENLYRAALSLKMAHMDRATKEKEAGVPPSPPSLAIMNAMRYVAEVDVKRGTSSLFKCDLCNWPLETKKDQGPHDLKYHPERVPDPGWIPAATEPAPQESVYAAQAPTEPKAELRGGDAAYRTTPPEEDKIAALTDIVADLAKQVKHLAARKKPGPRPKAQRPIDDPEVE